MKILKSEGFNEYRDLPSFINLNKIKQKDIQAIIKDDKWTNVSIVLYYWISEESEQ